MLQQDTHKFEARYNDSLIGPYPEAKAIYRERSPIHFTDRLSCPIILFQGLEDRVVPPNQSEMMADAVRKKGIKVKYVAFEGEQHGFRKAENIIRSLEEELAFYRDVFRDAGFRTVEGSDPESFRRRTDRVRPLIRLECSCYLSTIVRRINATGRATSDVCSRSHTLPHFQSSARRTRPAFTGLASM